MCFLLACMVNLKRVHAKEYSRCRAKDFWMEAGSLASCMNHSRQKNPFARINRSPRSPAWTLFVELSFISFHQLVQPLHLVVLGWKKQISNPVSSPTGLYKHLESCVKLSNLAMPLHSLSAEQLVHRCCVSCGARWHPAAKRKTSASSRSLKPTILSHETAYTATAGIGSTSNRYMYWATLLLSAKKKQPSSSCYLLHTSIP